MNPAPSVPAEGMGLPLAGLMHANPNPTDMEVDVEDALADHEAPIEKTDADFFNGARILILLCVCLLFLPLSLTRLCMRPPFSPQTSRTILTTRI